MVSCHVVMIGLLGSEKWNGTEGDCRRCYRTKVDGFMCNNKKFIHQG